MEVIEEKNEKALVFAVAGRLDSNTSPAFEQKIMEAIGKGEIKVVVDFAGLDYIASAGMRVVLKAAKELKQKGGAIVLCSLKDYVKEVFEIAGFDSFLPLVATRTDALASV
ncbi:MAG: STAS domain-containing protein [Thermodesulfobacteriota bacterium]